MEINWIRNSIGDWGIKYFELVGWHNIQFRMGRKLLMINIRKIYE